MTCIDALLVIIMAMPQFQGDGETPQQRLDRVHAFAELACEYSPEMAANLTTLAEHESRFARYVWYGCKTIPSGAANCDRDRRTGKPRAKGPFQLWRWCKAVWAAEDGSRAQLRAGMACASRRLRSMARHCRGRNQYGLLAGMFAGYRSRHCEWTGSRSNGVVARTKTRDRILTRLRRLMSANVSTPVEVSSGR